MPDPKFNPYDPEVLKTLPTIHGGIGDRPDIDDDDGPGDTPGAARVQAVRGDMFEFGPAHSEAMVVWMRSGFNGLHTSWWHDFVPRWRTRRLLRRTTRGWEPFHMDGVHDRSWWTQPEPALLHIHKPVERLSYLYLHPNPDDTWAQADDVVRMTRQALDTVAQLPVTSVSFNGIQSATKWRTQPERGCDPCQADGRHHPALAARACAPLQPAYGLLGGSWGWVQGCGASIDGG